MFVPDMWGHEIFNLEPTVGVQAMYTTVTGEQEPRRQAHSAGSEGGPGRRVTPD